MTGLTVAVSDERVAQGNYCCIGCTRFRGIIKCDHDFILLYLAIFPIANLYGILERLVFPKERFVVSRYDINLRSLVTYLHYNCVGSYRTGIVGHLQHNMIRAWGCESERRIGLERTYGLSIKQPRIRKCIVVVRIVWSATRKQYP